MDKVKVTVVKRMNMNEIYGNNLPGDVNIPIAAPLCDQFKEGQEFIMGMNCPPEFCSWGTVWPPGLCIDETEKSPGYKWEYRKTR